MEATATFKPRDSFLGIWLETVLSNIRAEIGYLPSYFYVHEAEEEIAAEVRAKEEEIQRTGTNVSDKVWNPNTMKFDKTTLEEEFDYSQDPIAGAVHYNGNAVGIAFEMTNDQLDNFLDDAVVDLKPKSKEEARLFRYTLLTVLTLTGKCTSVQCGKRCNNDTDNLVLCNSVFKYFNGFALFAGINALDINEYMSKEQILKVMSYLNNKSMFDVDYAFAGYLRKAQEDYAREVRRVKSNNGAKEVSDDEIVTPIIFNNAYLNSMDLVNNKVPSPQILPSLKRTIEQKISKLTGIDLDPNRKEGLEIVVEGLEDPNIPTACIDLGQALLKIRDKKDKGYVYKQLALDLDTITGTGINIIGRAVGFLGPDSGYKYIYANLDKDQETARNLLMSKDEYLINVCTPEGKAEFDKVSAKLLPIDDVYAYYDFSNMHKYLEGMTNKQKKRFTNTLMSIVNLPWYNLGPVAMGAPFRFRFRDFKSYNDFTIISDKDVRVQARAWMAKPIGSSYGKLYMDRPGYYSDDNLVVHAKGDKFNVSYNGQEIDWQNP